MKKIEVIISYFEVKTTGDVIVVCGFSRYIQESTDPDC